jgi:CDP-diacylglycerol--serine O-phosphatidyltransferase
VAWRLAKFNISATQKYSFQGVPSPAAALVVASLPLIILYQYFDMQAIFINKWLLYVIILLLSFLMLSSQSFMAIKFTDYSVKNNGVKYLLIALSLIAIIALKWLAVPVIFILYVALSLFSRNPLPAVKSEAKETRDITV